MSPTEPHSDQSDRIDRLEEALRGVLALHGVDIESSPDLRTWGLGPVYKAAVALAGIEDCRCGGFGVGWMAQPCGPACHRVAPDERQQG